VSTRTLISLACGAAVALAAASYSAAPSPTPKADKAPIAFDKAPAAGTKATCPVSKEEFTVTAKTARSEYKGKHYVFCCPSCKEPFDKEPEKYAESAKAPAPAGHGKTSK
jgi:YHS domain-containing protein